MRTQRGCSVVDLALAVSPRFAKAILTRRRCYNCPLRQFERVVSCDVLRPAVVFFACVACGGSDKALDRFTDSGVAQGSSDAGPQIGESERVFYPTILHHIAIEVAKADVDSLNGVGERVPCRLTLDGTVIENAGVRNKGQTSLRPVEDKLSGDLQR